MVFQIELEKLVDECATSFFVHGLKKLGPSHSLFPLLAPVSILASQRYFDLIIFIHTEALIQQILYAQSIELAILVDECATSFFVNGLHDNVPSTSLFFCQFWHLKDIVGT